MLFLIYNVNCKQIYLEIPISYYKSLLNSMGGVGQILAWVTWVVWVHEILAWIENLMWVAWLVWVEILL